ncbi:hypothetical protein HHK36_032961 [Tetracentron sinense]|uniref:Uncharacterized protein n=1 Tax=Tetracentron sinense TaxID=13715 RepID=A0A834Y609_TETSI|nr:hypothetical protein HHK36_032961 [Tetracentron sinense]
MAKFSCFFMVVGRKKIYKGEKESSDFVHYNKGLGTLQVKPEHPAKSSETDEFNSTSFSTVSVPFGVQGKSTCKVKVVSSENLNGAEATEVGHEDEDGHDENSSIKKDFSDSDLQAQVLPSKSRRLWWKLFMIWSHKNMNKPWKVKSRPLPIIYASNQQGTGYSSDTLEPNRAMEQFPGSFLRESRNKSRIINNNQNWSQNQWVASSSESSSLSRVDEWVNSLESQPHLPINDEDKTGGSSSRSKTHMTQHSNFNLSEEFLQANSVIQSLSSASTAAHIKGMGLKVIPTISRFSSLRSIDLSGNFIVHITVGSLPRRLHTLNLSRNKIVAIEGLRELSRLRVLNLSYNRIFRIGRGLSNCMLIKELYLAGNKISDVEGVHRLLKLTVLDLSFNKITTAKSLSQLAANYNSLLALNLLGNPIQRNICDVQLRKTVSGILPQLAYLNKQPINPRITREVAMNSVIKAALGNNINGWSSHRKKVLKQVGQGPSSFYSGHRNSTVSGGQIKKPW